MTVLVMSLVMVFRAAAAATAVVIFTVVLSETNFGDGALGTVGRGGLMGACTGHGQGTGNDLGPRP